MGSKRREQDGSLCRNLKCIELINIEDIPENIVFEVLLRLPVKVLFKFKIVSKQWLSMISDPSFARMYVSRISLLSHSRNWTLIKSSVIKITSPTAKHLLVIKVPHHECSLGTNCLQQRLIIPSAQQVDDLNYSVIGVSNGLVLYNVCGRNGIYSYYICNLITGQSIILPPDKRHRFVLMNICFVTQVEDNVLTSYRVVGLDSPHSGSVFRFAVYCSEFCKWEAFDIKFREYIYIYMWKKVAFLDKIMHQMINQHRIMAYDPYNKPDSVRLISLPGVSFESYGRGIFDIAESLLDEHQGHLRFLVAELDRRENEFSGSLSIWVLDDYECGKWCLQHRVSISDIQFDGGRIRKFPVPLSSHPCDENIVFMMNTEAVFSYDLKTRKLKIEDDSTGNLCFPCRSYFLFVIPPWPVSIKPSALRSPKID